MKAVQIIQAPGQGRLGRLLGLTITLLDSPTGLHLLITIYSLSVFCYAVTKVGVWFDAWECM